MLSNKTKNHQLVLLHAIFRRAVKVYGLPRNPLATADRYRVRASGDIEVFAPAEIWALVRAAASDIDGTIFLTAAFTGLRRGELLGLRWRDIDFEASTIRVRASYAAGQLTTPKSGKGPGRADGTRRRGSAPPFHDLRPTFGTRMIREADIRRVQDWMGHTDIQTTMKYLHYESPKEDAALVARAVATCGCSFDDSAV